VLAQASRPAHAEFRLTRAQHEYVTRMANEVKAVLELGGKPQEVRNNVALAVQASLIASYARGLDQKKAEAEAEILLKPFYANPGATQRELGQLDALIIERTQAGVRAVVDPRLSPKYGDAVVFTVGAAAQSTLEKWETPTGLPGEAVSFLTEAATTAFRDLPPRSDPNSPFHHDEVLVASDPAPQPSVSSAPPPADPMQNADPDAITATTDDGRVIVGKPEGDGSTSMTVTEENLNAGQNNNSGNTKNRTGSDDGKKDEKNNNQKNDSGSGNSNGGGHHK
jgi:hypothetical protein